MYVCICMFTYIRIYTYVYMCMLVWLKYKCTRFSYLYVYLSFFYVHILIYIPCKLTSTCVVAMICIYIFACISEINKSGTVRVLAMKQIIPSQSFRKKRSSGGTRQSPLIWARCMQWILHHSMTEKRALTPLHFLKKLGTACKARWWCRSKNKTQKAQRQE